jgi:hypothetical protein
MKKQNPKLKKSVQTPQDHITSLQQEVIQLRAIVEAFKLKNEFIQLAGRPTLVVKLGAITQAWLPSPKHFAAATVRIKQAKLDERYNVLLVHAFTNLEVLN